MIIFFFFFLLLEIKLSLFNDVCVCVCPSIIGGQNRELDLLELELRKGGIEMPDAENRTLVL